VAAEAPAAEIRQLREPTPTFGIRGVRRSPIEAAEKALEVDDPECITGASIPTLRCVWRLRWMIVSFSACLPLPTRGRIRTTR
jgi:hypothetical protein